MIYSPAAISLLIIYQNFLLPVVFYSHGKAYYL